jgi:hypothetical protein
MADNGFGAKENSADFVLRMYRIDPSFKTKHGGKGTIGVDSFITLHDPNHKIAFPIVADGSVYPGSTLPVDPEIRKRRLLTGGDFDIESVRVAADGTLWFGDEFGPFLIHMDVRGKMLDAPLPLPGVKSPQNPLLNGATPNLPRSKGFEGMAVSCSGKRLYRMLEGPLTTHYCPVIASAHPRKRLTTRGIGAIWRSTISFVKACIRGKTGVRGRGGRMTHARWPHRLRGVDDPCVAAQVPDVRREVRRGL